MSTRQEFRGQYSVIDERHETDAESAAAARMARVVVADSPHHDVPRGARRMDVFVSGDHRREYRLSQPLKGFLTGAGYEDLNELAFVLGGAAIVVHGIDFGRGDFAHFSQGRIIDLLAAQ